MRLSDHPRSILEDLVKRGFRIQSVDQRFEGGATLSDVVLENGITICIQHQTGRLWFAGPLLQVRRVEQYLERRWAITRLGRLRAFGLWNLTHLFYAPDVEALKKSPLRGRNRVTQLLNLGVAK